MWQREAWQNLTTWLDLGENKKMTDLWNLGNWDDNEDIFINKGLQRRSGFVGEARDRGDDVLSLRRLWGIQVETAKGEKCRCGVLPTRAPRLAKLSISYFQPIFSLKRPLNIGEWHRIEFSRSAWNWERKKPAHTETQAPINPATS